MLRTLLIIFLTFLSFYSFGRTHEQRIRSFVVRKGVVGKTYIFGKWSGIETEEIHLTYLGKVKTKSGHTFKIVNSIAFWGIACRNATSRIIVFNGRNQYVGDYPLTMTYDLPASLENGNLVFRNTCEECDKNLVTLVNLKNGLPRDFFKNCKKREGDFYSFESY